MRDSSKILISIFIMQAISCILVAYIAVPSKQWAASFVISYASSDSNRMSSSSQKTISTGQVACSSEISFKKSAQLKIIDISHYNTVSNWQSVYKSVDAIYIKATESTNIIDSKFEEYSSGAAKVNLPMGFYHYFWPSSDMQNARRQAQFFYNKIKNCNYKLIPAVDVEITNGQNAKTICNNILKFEQEFESLSGSKAMIYSYANFANTYLTDKKLTKYKFWVASYGTSSPQATAVWKAYDAWQYHNAGNVEGISTAVDMNVATKSIFLTKK